MGHIFLFFSYKHRKMSFIATVRGIIISYILASCCILGAGILMFPPTILIRTWSIGLYNKILLSYAGWWFIWVSTFLEYVNGTKIIITGDKVPNNEPALLISNHPSEVDWLWFWCIALRKGMAGVTRVLIKKMMLYIPGLGWAMDCANFVFLSRNWERDQHQIRHSIDLFRAPDGYPFWLFIFPEGTDFSKRKHQKSLKYAKSQQLPEYKHLLLPRTKGFLHCLSCCGDAIDAVYDITVAYPENSRRPNPWTAINGTNPLEVHAHIRRFPLASLPTRDEDRAKWLFTTFAEKDELLSTFHRDGAFPRSKANEEEWRWRASPLATLLNFTFWTSFALYLNYLMYAWPAFRYYQFVAWTFFFASYHPFVRKLRGLDPHVAAAPPKHD